MALDPATAQELLKKLAEDRATYLDTINRTHDLLTKVLETQSNIEPHTSLSIERQRRNTGTTLATTTTDDAFAVSKDSNYSIEDDTDTDDDEALFVQHSLPVEKFDENGLRKHIREYEWTDAGKSMLGDIISNDEVLTRRHLFPTQVGPVADRSHLSHYSIFDVGNDGSPLPILIASEKSPVPRAMDIWKRISCINANPERQKQAVGRITIVREPSQLLFAALHYTMKDHFDMDKIFAMLEANGKTKAFPHSPWADDPRHRNTFVFNFEYYTIVGDECIPMKWQRADEELGETETHVPVSRCSSIVALSLEAKPSSKIRHKGRRNPIGRKEGEIFDPFSPWHCLSIQAYPDWRSSIDSHDSTKHYVNGPEAFLMTLRAEFKDAQKRLMDVYNRISDLVTTPSEFMFKQAIRDKLLFEDDDFTYSRRYFWAYQSLAIMNEDIKEMILAYNTTFTDNVWKGTNRIIWPSEENSARHIHWRKRMVTIRKDIEKELRGLEDIRRMNVEKIKEIEGLRDNLFSGTSVLESRKSVQQQAITVVQGNNIKILTLVTIFFLPLTFVTSVFGMTNMPQNDNFVRFGIVTLAVCFPTYLLIGSLNTESGFEFWTEKIHLPFTMHFWKYLLASCLEFIGIKPAWAKRYQEKPSLHPEGHQSRPHLKVRSQSATEGMAARGGFGPVSPLYSTPLNTQMPSMTPAATLERNPTVKFERTTRSFDTARSTELPRSPAQLGASAIASNTQAPAGWLSRIFGRVFKSKRQDDLKEYP